MEFLSNQNEMEFFKNFVVVPTLFQGKSELFDPEISNNYISGSQIHRLFVSLSVM